MDRVPLLLALIVAVPLTALVLYNTVDLVTDLADPCRTWGQGDGVTILRPDDECPSRSGTSMTRAEAVSGRIAFDGPVLFAAIAGVVGARRGIAAVAAMGAAALLIVAMLSMIGLFGFPLLALSILLFVAAGLLKRRVPASTDARRTATLFLVILLVLLVFHVLMLPGTGPYFFLPYPLAFIVAAIAIWVTWPGPAAPVDAADG